MNYFDLLQVPFYYNLNKEELRQNYLKLQAQYHPDRATSQSEKEQCLAKAIEINQGYQVLKDDYDRAIHMLKIVNIDLVKEEKREHHLPPKRLEQIWQAREQVELLTLKEEYENLYNSSISERGEILVSIDNCFNEKNYKEAAVLVIELKYFNNLVETIKQKLEQCG